MADKTPFNVRKRVTDIEDARTASQNFRDTKVISMTFNMDEDWHRQFKITAATRGISMKELLIECFDAYKRDQGKSR